MIKKIILCLIILLPFSSFANKPKNTSGFLYGLGLSTNKEIYKGYDRRNLILPIIGYRSEKLNVFGPFVSYEVQKFSDIKIVIQAAPRFQGFDDTDSYIFEGMADRKFSMDAGIGVNYKKNNWKISFSSMFDVFSRSNGMELTSAIAHSFRVGPYVIEPRITLSYLDSNHVDYYYGVNKDEVNESRTEYIGKKALNTGIGLTIATPIFLGGYTQINLQRTWFASEITNSPLVEDHSNLIVRLLFTRKF
jgi:outer membrane protein